MPDPYELHVEPDERHAAAVFEGVDMVPWLHQCWVDPDATRTVIVFSPDHDNAAGFVVDDRPGRDIRWQPEPHPWVYGNTLLAAGFVLVAHGTLSGTEDPYPHGYKFATNADPVRWLSVAASQLFPWITDNILTPDTEP